MRDDVLWCAGVQFGVTQISSVLGDTGEATAADSGQCQRVDFIQQQKTHGTLHHADIENATK